MIASAPPRVSLSGGTAVVAALLAAALALIPLAARGTAPWHGMLHLLQAIRASDGALPYRDFQLSSPPLGLALDTVAVALVGERLLALHLVAAVSQGLAVLLIVRIARRLEATPTATALSLLALAAHSPASPLWCVALLAVTDTLLRLGEADTPSPTRLAVAAGLWSGVAASLRPIPGLVAFATALMLVGRGMRNGGSPGRLVGLSAASFAATVTLPFLPTLLRGDFGAAWGDIVLSQPTFFRLGRFSFLEELVRFLGPPWSADRLARASLDGVHLLAAPLAIALLLLALNAARDGARRRLVAVAAGLAAALAVLIPRADLPHLEGALPLLVVALLASGSALAPRLDPSARRRGAILLGIFLVGRLVATTLPPLARLASGSLVPSSLPPLSGSWLPPATDRWLATQADRLADGSRGTPMLVLRPDAALFTLLAGLRNPTRWDFPIAMDLGADGEAQLLASIGAGDLPAVCFGFDDDDPLAPRGLRAAIERTMVATDLADVGQLFRSDVPAARRIVVELEVEASAPTRLQLFRDEGEGFLETRSLRWNLPAGRSTRRLRVEAAPIVAVRLDPAEAPGVEVIVRKLRFVRESGALDVDLATPEGWMPNDAVSVDAPGGALRLKTTGPDGWVVREVGEAPVRPPPPRDAVDLSTLPEA